MAQKFFNAGPGINFGPQVQPPINPADGDIYYNVTLGALQFYSKGQWFSFTQTEFDNGTSTLGTVVIDLSKGQLQKINLSPLAPTLTLKLVKGVVGNQYKIKVSFDDSCNYVTPVQIFSSQPLSGASQIYAKPNSRVLLTCTQTSAGIRCTTETYDAFVSTHLYESLSTSLGITSILPGLTFFGYLYKGLPYIFGDSKSGVQANLLSSNSAGYVVIPAGPITGTSYSVLSCGYQSVFGIEASTGLAWAWGNGGAGVLTANAYSATGPTYTPTQISGNRSWRTIYGGCVTAAIEASTGYIWTWGPAGTGMLGMYSPTDVSSPVSVLGGRSFSAVSLGWGSPTGIGGAVVALEGSTGNAYTWGYGGSLGNQNILVNASSPVSVFGGRSYSYISANCQASAAIEGSTGRAYTWGNNTNGLLGNSSAILVASSPVSVVGGRSFTKIIVASDAGTYNNHFMLAIEGSTGSIYTWGGQTNFPQLANGTGTTVNSSTVAASAPVSSPIAILGGRSFSDIRGGSQVAMAFEASTGAIYGWGLCPTINRYPRGSFTPYPVDPALHGNRFWSQVNISRYGSSGIEASTGLAYGWGYNASGESGTGVITNSVFDLGSPLSVVGGRSYSQLASQFGVSAGIEGSTGYAWTWGANQMGQLGVGSVTFATIPTAVLQARSYRQIVIGYYTMYGIEGSTGLIYAWGSGTGGSLGNGTATNVSAPTVVSGGRSYKQVTAASQTACALEASTGYAWTWGLNNSGSLGNNSLTASNVPVSVWGARSYKQVTIAFDILAAIEGSTGYIWTWGSNVGGGLGNGGVATANASSPVQVSGGKSFSKVASTSDSFYAVEGSTGLLYAWGNNSVGQCGTGSVSASPVSFYNVPVQMASGKSWKFIPSQPSDTPLAVALDSSNVLYYWGNHAGVTSMVQASLGAGYAVSGSPVSIARYNPKW